MSKPTDDSTTTIEKPPVVEPKAKRGFFSRSRPGTAGSTAKSVGGSTGIDDEKHPHPDALVVSEGEPKAEPAPDVTPVSFTAMFRCAAKKLLLYLFVHGCSDSIRNGKSS